ncbi:DUF342 domain-containing protein [Paraferrimonas sp. SM1919]|uniref:DUF342 domain-containing protein n=1 Tax=Paraferrimonas sp. SM1919 TaxID=2662263 RepID=UPI0013D0B4E1|nr:FapA family protein [Paraferrimonas sp. SM1919]
MLKEEQLHFDQQQGKLFAVIGAEQIPNLEAKKILDYVIEHTPYYSNLSYLSKQIAPLLQTITPLQQLVKIEIALQLDCQLNIHVTADSMAVEAQLIGAYGGKPISLIGLLEQLKEANINQGLSRQKILQVINRSAELAPGETEAIIIALGTPAQNGVDAQLENLVFPSQHVLNKSQGSELPLVSKGEKLLIKHPPSKGKQGFTVTGQLLPAIEGKDRHLQQSPGTTLNDTQDALIATRSGLPVHGDTGLRIDDILELEQVINQSQNIEFDGSIFIKGDVRSACTIKASGDIIIAGIIETANIHAGGDIIATKGIAGKQRSLEYLSCKLTAKGDICIGYAQYAQLQAQNIRVEKQLLHCLTHAQNNIELGHDDSISGAIVGGQSSAGYQVLAQEIGSTSHTKTLIQWGKAYPKLVKKRLVTLTELENLQINQKRIFAQIRAFEKPQDWDLYPELKAQAQAIQSELNDVETRLEKVQKEFEEIDKQVKLFYKQNLLIVTQQIFAGVDLSIGKRSLKVPKNLSSCHVSLVNENIRIVQQNLAEDSLSLI